MQSGQSIFDALHLIKHTDLELYTCFLLSLDIKGFTLAGSYHRNIVSFDSGAIRVYPVKVLRVRRKGDLSGHTFSLRPDFLLPHSPYSTRFLLTVVWYYHKRDLCIPAFTCHWQIGRSTLYIWLKLFEKEAHYWIKALSSLDQLACDLASEKLSIPSHPRSFLYLHDMALWNSFGITTPLPPYIWDWIPPPTPHAITS